MPGPRLRPYRSPPPAFALAEHARAAGLDIEVVRLVVGENPSLKMMGKFRDGRWIYTNAAFARIANAVAERRAQNVKAAG